MADAGSETVKNEAEQKAMKKGFLLGGLFVGVGGVVAAAIIIVFVVIPALLYLAIRIGAALLGN